MQSLQRDPNMKMPLAFVAGERQAPAPGISGTCICCESPVVSKCGERRIWHWAHKSRRRCDAWWENETDWHRRWKGEFPESWREIVHRAESGERHIADVTTDQAWVIEFQHSAIHPEERRARETFYGKLVWVVDGLSRKRDRPRFLSAWEAGVFAPIGPTLPVRRVSAYDFPRLEEWVTSTASVYFDLGDDEVLWWLLPKRSGQAPVYLAHFPRTEFIELHRRGATEGERGFDRLVEDYRKYVAEYESTYRAPVWISVPPSPFPVRPPSFARRRQRL